MTWTSPSTPAGGVTGGRRSRRVRQPTAPRPGTSGPVPLVRRAGLLDITGRRLHVQRRAAAAAAHLSAGARSGGDGGDDRLVRARSATPWSLTGFLDFFTVADSMDVRCSRGARVAYDPGSRSTSIPTQHRSPGYRSGAGRPSRSAQPPCRAASTSPSSPAHATACTLVLFDRASGEPFAEIPFPEEFRIGDVFAMTVFDLDVETIEYGYRMEARSNPAGAIGSTAKILLDPYARLIGGRDVWGATPDWRQRRSAPRPARLRGLRLGGDRPLEMPIEDLVIYEMHVRGFTRHPSSGVRHPGTFAGMREKIPYLKELGVNCVELMPIFEFDEFENSRVAPRRPASGCCNYWGYSTVGFFAPKAGYAATGKLGMQVDEFKDAGQGAARGPASRSSSTWCSTTPPKATSTGRRISFRGLDNRTYYMLTPGGLLLQLQRHAATRSTATTRSSATSCSTACATGWPSTTSTASASTWRRSWAATRTARRWPTRRCWRRSPTTRSWRDCKLIAEAWDAGGLYQVGCFPAYGRWAEWNGKYRDDVRRFLKGDAGMAGELATRLLGSPDLYHGRGTGRLGQLRHLPRRLHAAPTWSPTTTSTTRPTARTTATAPTTTTSWNCGVEGPTDDPAISALRRRQIKNALAMLLVSQGVPMLLMGDECGRTQHGNNNAYCQDSDARAGSTGRWWSDNADLLRFVRAAIAFRRAHPVLRGTSPDRAGARRLLPGRQLARRAGVRAGLVAGGPAAGGDVLRPPDGGDPGGATTTASTWRPTPTGRATPGTARAPGAAWPGTCSPTPRRRVPLPTPTGPAPSRCSPTRLPVRVGDRSKSSSIARHVRNLDSGGIMVSRREDAHRMGQRDRQIRLTGELDSGSAAPSSTSWSARRRASRCAKLVLLMDG